MYLLGATLTKFLATVAAVMTVTAGLPSFQCRCPDGRVKLFCHATASSASCCCAPGSCSSAGAKSCCGEKKANNSQAPKSAKKCSCCAQAGGKSQRGADPDDSRPAVRAAGCVKSVVAAAPFDSLADAGATVHPSTADALPLWAAAPLVPSAASSPVAARPPPAPHATPPDLVVLLCHFTC